MYCQTHYGAPQHGKGFGRNNKIVKKLVKLMVKAELAVNLSKASQKLDHWLTVICKDYQTKNNLISSATDATVLGVVQQQSVLVNTLVLSNQNMEIQLEKLTGELAGIHEDVNSQSTSITTALSTSLKGGVQGVFGCKDSNNDKTTAAHEELAAESAERVNDLTTDAAETPLSLPAHPSASAHDQASEEMSLFSNKPAPKMMTAFIESMQGMLQDAKNKGEKGKLVELSWTPQQGNSVKGVTVKDVLLQLMQEK